MLSSDVKRLILFSAISQCFTFVFPLIAIFLMSVPSLSVDSSMLILSAVLLLVSGIGPLVGNMIDGNRGRAWCLISGVLYLLGIASIATADSLPIWTLGLGILAFFVSLLVIQILSSALIEG